MIAAFCIKKFIVIIDITIKMGACCAGPKKKKPEDETPKSQAEDAKPSEDLSDDELNNAAGGNMRDMYLPGIHGPDGKGL